MGQIEDLLQDAADKLGKVLRPTPLVHAQTPFGPGRLALKCENFQPTGSFKIRGASYVVGGLTSAERTAGVVAYSTGNHAQAVAHAALTSGIAATVVMSPDAPADKIRATEALGAQVVMANPTSAARQEMAERLHRERGAALVPPFDDLRVIAGQGSIAFELHQQLDRDTPVTLYVPVGGGGLIAGVASAIKLLRPEARVVGVEPELEDDASRSFAARQLIVADGPSASIADAIKVQCLGSRTFPIILDMVDEMITVEEDRIRAACREVINHEHMVVEPAAAIAYAVAKDRATCQHGLHVAVLSGGNIAWPRLAELIA